MQNHFNGMEQTLKYGPKQQRVATTSGLVERTYSRPMLTLLKGQGRNEMIFNVILQIGAGQCSLEQAIAHGAGLLLVDGPQVLLEVVYLFGTQDTSLCRRLCTGWLC